MLENRSKVNFERDKFNQQTFRYAVLKIDETTRFGCWIELSSRLDILQRPRIGQRIESRSRGPVRELLPESR